jgi:phage-related tail protein
VSTEYTLQEQLRSADCGSCDYMSDRAADTIDALQAEVAVSHANINTKANFIDATINQLAYADEVVDTLRAEVARLRNYLDDQADTVARLRAALEGAADKARIMKLYQTWGKGDLTQADFNEAFKET